MKKRLRIRVTGKVQGVFFRASTEKKAHELGLTGWVRNEDNGDVLIEAEGADEVLASFVAWCKQGPSGALVTSLEKSEIALIGDRSFDVVR